MNVGSEIVFFLTHKHDVNKMQSKLQPFYIIYPHIHVKYKIKKIQKHFASFIIRLSLRRLRNPPTKDVRIRRMRFATNVQLSVEKKPYRVFLWRFFNVYYEEMRAFERHISYEYLSSEMTAQI